jgi:membrane-associated phospholipid phosphatase
MFHRKLVMLVMCASTFASSAQAQGPRPDSTRTSVRWYHVGATLGGIAALSLLDRSVQRWSQDTRTSGKDDVAKIVRHVGQPEVYLPVALGTLAVGLISKDDDVLRAGGRIAGSLALTGAAANFLKLAVGRTRPSYTTDPYKFKPFTRAASWPSGHTSTAFALASSVGDEIHSLPVSIGLYGIASMTAWSRVNDNRHWLSDVAAGAIIGITSSKIMNGRWRFLGASGPRILLSPEAVGVTVPIR